MDASIGMEELRTGWSPERLADAVGRNARTVQRWCARGLVPSQREGGGRGCGNGGRVLIPDAIATALVNGEYVFPVAA